MFKDLYNMHITSIIQNFSAIIRYLPYSKLAWDDKDIIAESDDILISL